MEKQRDKIAFFYTTYVTPIFYSNKIFIRLSIYFSSIIEKPWQGNA